MKRITALLFALAAVSGAYSQVTDSLSVRSLRVDNLYISRLCLDSASEGPTGTPDATPAVDAGAEDRLSGAAASADSLSVDAGHGELRADDGCRPELDSVSVASALAAAHPLRLPGFVVPRVPDDSEARFLKTRQRFLPMRRRIDREIGSIKYAYKGEVMLGLTASYGTLKSDDTDFMLLLDNINADGSITTVKPFFGYFYRDNNCIGARFGYRRIDGSLGNADLDLGDKNDISFSVSDMGLTSDQFSFGIFHRSYAGIDPKGRFGLFAELELSCTSGSSRFTYKSGDEIKRNESDMMKLKLSFNPGVAVYIFPNVCGTLSFGLGGIQYTTIKQYDDHGVKTGSREASAMRFRLNLADINIGMIVHLWDKKKK